MVRTRARAGRGAARARTASASCCTPATPRATCTSATTWSTSAPSTGAPNIRDLEGGRRYGDIEAFRNILKLTHALGVLHWQGGIVVEPVDVPVAGATC